MTRAVLWVVGGLIVLVLGMVASAPELLGDLTFTSGLLVLAFAAGIPGSLVLLAAGVARRRSRATEPADATTSPSTRPADRSS